MIETVCGAVGDPEGIRSAGGRQQMTAAVQTAAAAAAADRGLESLSTAADAIRSEYCQRRYQRETLDDQTIIVVT